MARPASAVLWDLDGTLIDSEPLHRRAICATLVALGANPDLLEAHEFVGRGERDFWAYSRAKFALPHDPDDLVHRKDGYYAELIRTELRTMPGAVECLAWMQQKNIPMAIASGSSPRAIAAATAAVGLQHYFAEFVSSLDPSVPRSKPHPDVFLEAARRLSIPPHRCLVIEDAQWGVRAAVAANMRVIAVPNDWTRHHDFTGAERILPDLASLRFEHL
jgi:HAD superfamily hydrolase (TIGR01509 family)